MTPTRPGDEPDPGDMSTDPEEKDGGPSVPDLPDDDAATLGDFA